MGDNGERYRDWVCVYSTAHDLEKCRLESHMLEIPEVYETFFEWDGHDVQVRSSLPMDDRLLMLPSFFSNSTGSGGGAGDHHDSAAAPTQQQHYLPVSMRFSRTIRQRMLGDARLLPVRDTANHYVDRGNITVYTNSVAGEPEEVLIVYAPSSLEAAISGAVHHPQRLEFASFMLRPREEGEPMDITTTTTTGDDA